MSLTPTQSQDSLDDQSDDSPKKVQFSESKSPTPGYEKYKTWKDERYESVVFNLNNCKLGQLFPFKKYLIL